MPLSEVQYYDIQHAISEDSQSGDQKDTSQTVKEKEGKEKMPLASNNRGMRADLFPLPPALPVYHYQHGHGRSNKQHI